MEQITLYFRKADAAEEGSMARFLNPPIAIPWRDLGRSALRIVVLTTAAGMVAAGKGLWIAGARLQQFGENLGR